MAKWRLMRRRGRLYRKLAERGRDYDGSRWELFKTYDDEAIAQAALALHEGRATSRLGSKTWQYKLEPPKP